MHCLESIEPTANLFWMKKFGQPEIGKMAHIITKVAASLGMTCLFVLALGILGAVGQRLGVLVILFWCLENPLF